MRWVFVMSVCAVVCAVFGVATAQDFSRAEVFGGISYTGINTSGDTSGFPSRENAAGWESSGSVNTVRWIWGEASLAGYYRTVDGFPLRDYFAVAGPRFNFRRFFVHALFGMDRLIAPAFDQSENGLAGGVGGGVEFPLIRYLAVRASADDLFTRHDIFGSSRYAQNVRVSVGVVYRFRFRGAPEAFATATPSSSGRTTTTSR
jgi:hypothetical protein